ncbi:MAG: response regulator transcription factor [Sulfurovum sp.]|nr:response regulator transcription factor [Sulfurovum sp.]
MNNLTLLYAEDDPQSRKNYAFVLEEYFFRVYTAKDGREALDLYHEKKPDVLLLDITMPFIDGLEVTETVRKRDKDIPIIILTAHADQKKLLTAIPLGLSEYLLKPIDDRKLRETMIMVISEIQNRGSISLKKKLLWNKENSNLFYEDENVKLTKKEHKLMILLINSIGEYFTHDRLILQIWDDEIPDASHDNKLHQLVYRLNKKINGVTNKGTQLIENSYTLGYRITCYS